MPQSPIGLLYKITKLLKYKFYIYVYLYVCVWMSVCESVCECVCASIYMCAREVK